MSRTTIAIHSGTRARLKVAAQRESQTLDAFLLRLLDEHEKRLFWDSIAHMTPESYSEAISDDGDTLNEDYVIEDGSLERGVA